MQDGLRADQHHRRREIEDQREEMSHDENRHVAGSIQLSKKVHRHRFAGHIHARGWLIQYEHVRFGGQCARQHHALPLTRGEVPKQVAAKGLDSEKRQRAVRRVPVGATYSPQRRGLRACSH